MADGGGADSGRSRGPGLALLIGAVVAAYAGCWMFAVLLPATVREYREYRTAAVCPGSGPAGPVEDCLRTVTFTVRDTVVDEQGGLAPRRHVRFEATLSGAPYGNGVVAFGAPGPVLRQLRTGDRVDGVVWRGAVMRLIRYDDEQATADEPRDEPQMFAGLGVTALLLAVLGGWFGLVRLVRPGRPEPWTWRLLGRGLSGVVLVAGLGWAYGALLLRVPWQAVAPVAVALAVAVSAPLIALRRRQRAPAKARSS
ncbi:hypothetical protein [Streptomyces fuscichromogenes]|uniref:Uncharacterized protein n=1 Tax=Streptomyces fuscichromogenes TaxID=1324013 RepID=A0A917XF72_9ACTN|nr:hypothetical protein [Streptomyces fuscichromogenes]GGN18286.1 hypothetical protein GCM10011578_047450 [Streptomyces fuscichromogenes]